MTKSPAEIRSLTRATSKTSRNSFSNNTGEIKCIVRRSLSEQPEGSLASPDETVVKTVAAVLTSFGIYEVDRTDMLADFQHLRRWRKSMEQAQSYTLKAVITLIVTGFAGAVWFGVKALLGK